MRNVSFIWVFILVWLGAACDSTSNGGTDLSWSDVFGEGNRITISAPDTLMPPSSTRQVVPLGDSLLAVADSRNRRILLVGPDGSIRQTLGQAGDGPGEFSLLSYLDAGAQGRLYAFDVDGRTVSVFSAQDPTASGSYAYTRQFTLATSMVDMAVAQSHLFTLSNTSGKMLLTRHTLEGEVAHETQVSAGSDYEIFAGRFNLGGLAWMERGQIAVASPGGSSVQWYQDTDLAPVGDASPPQDLPEAATFPADLDPYDYTDEHAAWWSSAWRVLDVYALAQDTYAVVTYKPDGQDVEAQRVQVYEYGSTEARATVQVPDDLLLIGADSGRLYATADPAYAEGEETPLHVVTFRYQLN